MPNDFAERRAIFMSEFQTFLWIELVRLCHSKIARARIANNLDAVSDQSLLE